MAQITYRIPYTNRDFNSLMDALRARIPVEVPEWNDFLQSNYGVFLISTVAAIGDWLAFVSDRNAAECFVNTALGKSSLVNLLQLINYQIRGMVPAYTTIRVTLPAALPADVLIPKYTEFSDASGANRFISTIGASIPAGNLSVDVLARQGAWQSEGFTSNGSLQQRFILGRTDIAEGFIRVWVGLEEWTQSDDNTFVGTDPTSRVFRVLRTSVNSGGPQTITPALAPELIVTTVEFGDDLEGKVPPSGTPIRIDYLTTKGDTVRIPSGAVTGVVSILYDATGVPATVSCVNLDAASGGDQAESIYAARRRYPAAFRTTRRAVTTYDYQKYAESYDGVLQARVYDLNNNADNDNNLTAKRPIPIEKAIPFYQARVYVIPRADFASEALNHSLREWLQARTPVDKQVVVVNPTVVNLDIKIRLKVYATFNAEDVKHNVITIVRDFFRLTRTSEIQIGSTFFTSRLISLIQQSPGVAWMDLHQPSSDISVGFDEILRLGNVTVELASQPA